MAFLLALLCVHVGIAANMTTLSPKNVAVRRTSIMVTTLWAQQSFKESKNILLIGNFPFLMLILCVHQQKAEDNWKKRCK